MKAFLIIVLLICSSNYVDAQVPKSADSLKTYLKTHVKDTNYVFALNEYAFIKIQQGDYVLGEKLISQIENLSSKLNYGTGHYKATNLKGVIQYFQQNSEKAMEYFLESNEIIKKYHLPNKFLQNSLNNIGIIYDQMGDQKNATKYAFELIHFQEKHQLKPLKSSPYTQIGDNLKLYKKYKESLKYYQKALKIEFELGDKVGVAICENRIGNVYEDMNQNENAVKHFKIGLANAQEANHILLESDLLVNLGRMFLQEKKYDLCEEYLKKAEKFNRELNSPIGLKSTCSNLGDLYLIQKNYTLCEKYYLEALKLAQELGKIDQLYTAYDNLSDLYEQKSDFKKAYEYKLEANVAKDSLFALETLENSEELLRKFQTKEKEQRIKSLSTKNKLKNLQIKSAQNQKIYLLGGLLLLLIIGSLLFFQSRNRKKTNERLTILNAELDEANKAKARFFSILNHDLRGPVANLIWFLQMQKENPELLDAESKNRIQEKTISGVENLLVSMEDMLQWSKSQMENFKPQPTLFFVGQLFEDIRIHFSSEGQIQLTFENAENIQIKTDENYLKTIVRNLTGNAMKALAGLESPTIEWKAWQENNYVFLSIKDNGKGATNEQLKALYDDKEVIGIKSGLGLHLIRDLAKAINCNIQVESVENKGTIFILKLLAT